MNLLATIAVLLLLASCSTSKHITTTRIVTDSTALHERDSIIRVRTESLAQLSRELREAVYGQVLFDTVYLPGDSIRPVVRINADGSLEATGRLRSVTITNEKMSKQLTTLRNSYDSLYQVKRKDSIQVQREEVVKERIVKRSVLPWWIWLICLPGFLVAAYLKFKRV